MKHVIMTLTCVASFLGAVSSLAATQAEWASTKKADAAITARDWVAAEADLERILTGLRLSALKPSILGPIYFKKGWCEYKQEKWEEAMRSFGACYKACPSKKHDRNPFHHASLRHWADAAYMHKDYKKSSKLYRQYLAETPRGK